MPRSPPFSVRFFIEGRPRAGKRGRPFRFRNNGASRPGVGHKQALKDRFSKELLERLYVEERLSTLQIGHRLELDPESVRQLLIRYGIPRRPRWSRQG